MNTSKQHCDYCLAKNKELIELKDWVNPNFKRYYCDTCYSHVKPFHDKQKSAFISYAKKRFPDAPDDIETLSKLIRENSPNNKW